MLTSPNLCWVARYALAFSFHVPDGDTIRNRCCNFGTERENVCGCWSAEHGGSIRWTGAQWTVADERWRPATTGCKWDPAAAWWSVIAIISSALIGLCVCHLSSLQSSYTVLALVISVWGCICILFPVRLNSLLGLLAMALLMRLLFVFHSPELSDDLYRALWEGKLTASGGNPYLTAPSSFSVM